MSTPFNRKSGLIIVDALVDGPLQQGVLRLALDTGATYSIINPALLVSAGYDPASATERVQITTASGVEYAARLSLNRLASLGQERIDFPVIAHTLPPSTTVDGLLGLDFLRGCRLEIDFRNGRLDLS